MQVFKKMVIAIALSFIGQSILACTCAWQGHFEEYAANSKLIVLAKILTIDNEESSNEFEPKLTIEVIDSIKGVASSSKITLYGDPGWLCLGYIDNNFHKVGGRYLFALPSGASEQGLGGCGESWLRVKGRKAISYEYTNKGYKKSYFSYRKLIRRIKRYAL